MTAGERETRAARRREARRRRNPWIVAEARRIRAQPLAVPPVDLSYLMCTLPIVMQWGRDTIRRPCGVYVQGGAAALDAHQKLCHPGRRS